ncbi:MAG: cupin domain-containing protein [Pseudomonadota bacterium]
MEAGKIHTADLQEFWTEERCFITELMNTVDAPAASLALCRVEPGVTTQWHCLNVTEWYIVSQGRGLMALDEQEPFEIRPGDCVQIPAKAAQRVSNIGSEDLIFKCLCMPRFTPESYEALE